MYYPKRLITATMCAYCAFALSGPAKAEGKAENDDHISVGVGAVMVEDPFIDSDTQAYPFPYLSVRQDAFYIEGEEIGLTFDKKLGDIKPSIELFGAARIRDGRDREKVTADAGARLSLETDFGTLSAEYRRDITDTFNGGEAIARYSLPISMGRLTVTPALQATWMDRKTTNYLYGITAAQQEKMIDEGRDVILPLSQIDDDALNLGGDLTITFALNDHLTAFSALSGTYLDKSIRNSAAIDQDWEANAAFGLTYTF
ncbi:MipA/OmpV family protein [Altererythrobacter sp. MF3-039]|uniref:MipA/OmpV family protein n=1 Tax=Altererythrobacter sp. MF3-039 TaxID=3252901 RepID=UPI00390CAF09